MSKQFEKLVGLLKELFQLDQPDLDFGLYRIMHAKADEISQFLDKDLLPQVQQAFSQYKTADKAELEKELRELVAGIEKAGMDPDGSPKVNELKQKIVGDSVDVAALENEVYDHLFSFFRRYYHEGDFLAKRVYKPDVYAIPYEGEEVKLHWANRDQYYIKTSEYLRDYAFTLKPGDAKDPMRVHFRLVDAAEGEAGNVKATSGRERVFILATEDFIATEGGELIIRFHYRPAVMSDWSEKALDEATAAAKKKPPVQKVLLEDAVKRVLSTDEASLKPWIAELSKKHVKIDGKTADHSRLEGHLNRYTKRHEFDYFIHKDLGGFLRRELDFFIKNEVMHLDDVESESAPRVEQYLSKIKVVRKIAHKLIDFLAQLEEFQKKLWTKAKFIHQCDYLISIGHFPTELDGEIVNNAEQISYWRDVYGINKIGSWDLSDDNCPADERIAQIRKTPNIAIDTSLFNSSFKQACLAAFDEIDREIDGELIHSDNFHALNSLRRKYRGKVSSIYIDPPYNTDASAILYKNDYKDASWLSSIQNRLEVARPLLSDDGIICVAIDDIEFANLKLLLEEVFGKRAVLGVAVVRSNPSGRSTPKGMAEAHDYAIFSAATDAAQIGRLPRSEKQLSRYGEKDAKGRFEWVNFRKHGGVEASRSARPKMYFPFYVSDAGLRIPEMEWNTSANKWDILDKENPDEVVVWPNSSDGEEKRWKWGVESVLKSLDEFCARPDQRGETGIYLKARMNEEGMLPLTWWDKKEYSATEYGTNFLTRMFGKIGDFSFPKSIHLVEDCLRATNLPNNGYVLDFFGGSGTTAHAVMNLRRSDSIDLKFLLAEANPYFDTVLIPRVLKAAYATKWQDGKPVEGEDSIPIFVRYVRLESYEDAIGNLTVERTSKQESLLEDSASQGDGNVREGYILRYMLNVETRNSQSLLNMSAFNDPTAYNLRVKKADGEESVETNVDLLETFNSLIGLTVNHIAAPHTFSTTFKHDDEGRLRLEGRLRQDDDGPWWFRTVDGVTPDGRKTLVIWRKLTGDAEQDNLVLDEWFTRSGYSTLDYEFDLIYVNGDNNLENLRQPDETWKVRLIEEDFHRLMFDVDNV